MLFIKKLENINASITLKIQFLYAYVRVKMYKFVLHKNFYIFLMNSKTQHFFYLY